MSTRFSAHFLAGIGKPFTGKFMQQPAEKPLLHSYWTVELGGRNHPVRGSISVLRSWSSHITVHFVCFVHLPNLLSIFFSTTLARTGWNSPDMPTSLSATSQQIHTCLYLMYSTRVTSRNTATSCGLPPPTSPILVGGRKMTTA